MSGRGNLLSLFHKATDVSELSVSSGELGKDSGLDVEHSVSSGEYRRIARNEISKDLASAFETVNVSMGRGRGNFLQCFKVDAQDPKTEKHQTPFPSTQKIVTNITAKKVETSDESVASSNSRTGLFCPNVTQGKKGNHDFFQILQSYSHYTSNLGTPVNLVCNYIELKFEPNKGVYMYEVSFNPPVDSSHLRMKYLNEHRTKIGGTKIFDSVTLYLPILLQDNLTTLFSKSVDNTDIEIRLLFKRKESLKNCLQLYNILFDRVMKTLNYIKFDRKHFDPSQPKVIPMAKLEVWPGLVTAVDVYDGGLMLCCDVSHRLLCQKTVLDMLIEIYQHDKSSYQDKAKKFLIGNIVLTRYNNRTYKIDDICFSQNPHSKFETRTGSCTYLEYYKSHHNINIKDERQPLLISLKHARRNDTSNTDDIRFSLIPELCFLTGLHDEIRSDKKLMREISSCSSVSPNQRILALDNFIKNVNKNDEAKAILENWGLSLVRTDQSLVGRKIDAEKILFANNTVLAGPTSDFSRDVCNNVILEIIDLRNWILIHYKNDLRSAKALVNNMERCCESFGMKVCKPKIVSLELDRVDTYVDALRRNINTDTQIVVCICPTSRDDRYNAIKKICCSESPIASQVIYFNSFSMVVLCMTLVEAL